MRSLEHPCKIDVHQGDEEAKWTLGNEMNKQKMLFSLEELMAIWCMFFVEHAGDNSIPYREDAKVNEDFFQ